MDHIGRVLRERDVHRVVLIVQPCCGDELQSRVRGGERRRAVHDRVGVGLHLLAQGGGLGGGVFNQRLELRVRGDAGVIARLICRLLGAEVVDLLLRLADQALLGLQAVGEPAREIPDILRHLVDDRRVDVGQGQIREQRPDDSAGAVAVIAQERLERIIDGLFFDDQVPCGARHVGLVSEIRELVVVFELGERLFIGVLGEVDLFVAQGDRGLQAAEVVELHADAALLLVERVGAPRAGGGCAVGGQDLDEHGLARRADGIGVVGAGRDGEPLALDPRVGVDGDRGRRDPGDRDAPFAAVVIRAVRDVFQLHGVARALDEPEDVVVDLLRLHVSGRDRNGQRGIVDRGLCRQGAQDLAVLLCRHGVQSALRGRERRGLVRAAGGVDRVRERAHGQHAQAQQQGKNGFEMFHDASSLSDRI